MNLQLILAVISGLLCYSPTVKKDPQILVAQFNLYIDTNSFKDGEFNLTWETKIDRTVYKNDCEAMYDLYTFRPEICTPFELQGIEELLKYKNLIPQKREKQIH